jgi:hypothetical protein
MLRRNIDAHAPRSDVASERGTMRGMCGAVY